MPEIGRPVGNNSFRKIKKTPLGRDLNRMSGIEDNKFVDRNQHNRLSKDSFLQLLSSQLRNQDPFSPIDQKKFAADLAQFSQLEQLANLNNQFEKNNANTPYQAKFIGASFLGREVLTKGVSIEHDGKAKNIDLPFTLPKPAKKLLIKIFDQSNNMVGRIELDGRGQGVQSALWDGYALDGSPAVKGIYRFEVHGWDDQFNEFRGETKSKGVVTGVSFEGSQIVLKVNGKEKVHLRDVDNLSLPEHGEENLAALRKKARSAYNK